MIQIERELKGAELTLTALCMLLGKEAVDFYYYENDPEWWALRLYTRRN